MKRVFPKSPLIITHVFNVSFLLYSTSPNRQSLPSSSSPKLFESSDLLFSTTGTVVAVVLQRRTQENHFGGSQMLSSAAAAAARPPRLACCLCRNATCSSGRRRDGVFSELVRWSYFPVDGEEDSLPPPKEISACCVCVCLTILTSCLPPLSPAYGYSTFGI